MVVDPRVFRTLKEVAIDIITSTIVWPQDKNREETQPHPLTENWIKDLLSIAPPIRTRLNAPTVTPSHQEASIRFLSIRGQIE